MEESNRFVWREKEFSKSEDSYGLFWNIGLLSRGSPELFGLIPSNPITCGILIRSTRQTSTESSSFVRARARMRARILPIFFRSENDRTRTARGLGDRPWSPETLSGAAGTTIAWSAVSEAHVVNATLLLSSARWHSRWPNRKQTGVSSVLEVRPIRYREVGEMVMTMQRRRWWRRRGAGADTEKKFHLGRRTVCD